MAKSRHDRIVEILFNLAKKCKSYDKVYADHISEDYKIIPLLSHYKRGTPQVYPYRPDLWFKLKSKKIDIVEVWDSQSEDACAEDILFAALTPNLDTLGIVCLQKDQYELALKLTKLVLSSLFDDEGKLLLEPSSVLPYIIFIPNEIITRDEKIEKFLSNKLHLR